MPNIQEITLQNRRFQELEHRIRRHQDIIKNYESDISSSNKKLTTLEAYKNRMLPCITENGHITTYVVSSTSDMFNYITGANTQLSSIIELTLNNRITELRSILDHLHQDLRVQRRALSPLLETREKLVSQNQHLPKTLKIKEIRKRLYSLDNVKKASAFLGQKTPSFIHKPYLRFVLSGIFMTPTINRYDWVKSDNPSVALQDIVVIIDLRDQRIRLLPKSNEQHLSPFHWANSRQVHPHVLDAADPCFGDFGGPITEALNNHDWETLVTVLRMFLQTADAYDDAGKHWVHAVAPPTSYTFDKSYCRNSAGIDVVFLPDSNKPGHWKPVPADTWPNQMTTLKPPTVRILGEVTTLEEALSA